MEFLAVQHRNFGFFDGTENIRFSSLSAYMNGGRETNFSRTNISLSINNNKTVFTLPDSTEDKVDNQNINLEFNYTKKLSEHWAVGVNTDLSKSLYENIDLRMVARPRVEYSFTPYKNFNNERVLVQYIIGPEYSNYSDTTIYFKTKELQFSQSVNLITSVTKPWGSVNIGAFFSHYLSDFKKNNLSFSGAVNWRIFKGFQFGMGGSYSFVRNQINIEKGQASVSDVLTRRRALLSSYNYFFAIGFSYRFGSIFNNAVFPAFKGLNFSLNL